jgi:hypothetical protein
MLDPDPTQKAWYHDELQLLNAPPETAKAASAEKLGCRELNVRVPGEGQESEEPAAKVSQQKRKDEV